MMCSLRRENDSLRGSLSRSAMVSEAAHCHSFLLTVILFFSLSFFSSHLLVADGEWDARSKLTPRPVSAVAGKTDGESGVHGRGTPRRRNETCWSRTGSGTRGASLLPARFQQWMGIPTGSRVSTARVLPADETKLVGRGRGVGRENQAYSPPGQAKQITESLLIRKKSPPGASGKTIEDRLSDPRRLHLF